MTTTIDALFTARAKLFENNVFLRVPGNAERAYHPDGYDCTYGQALAQVMQIATAFKTAGYGHGHRVAVLLENRPEMLLVKLALARCGISWVPVNPDYRPAEVAYLLQDCGAELALVAPTLTELMQAGIAESGRDVQMVVFEQTLPVLPQSPSTPPKSGPLTAETESSLIYTSGTTGRPKGCMLSHAYEVEMGQWYASRGGLIQFEAGHTKVYCPLPLFHVNAAILLFMAVIETGSTHIIPERFRASAWWRELAETEATAAHYLGIIIPALMNRAPEDWEQKHKVTWAVGAGVEPTLHRPFEERFGFPLVEVWGMTEMCRMLADCHEPRQIDTRAMGRPQPGLDVRVVDENDIEVVRGTPGEMVLRYSDATPRRGAFSGYLNLPVATEEAWRGGWFHTGDTVMMDDSDMVFFVDRKKNIIRRSGENIAAAEIEACLQDHPKVDRVAVVAVPDAMRDEEVMACIQIIGDVSEALAEELFEWCFARLAYYKAPGWIRFMADIPVTGTQKIQKHSLFGAESDPTAGALDYRGRKKRG
ncbi:AMP-binding protein [Shimia marina]|uniref:Putative sulfoacetate--CoA ligase n=1 Tax=Shimia marina TaxID=321267 RepID=A0A0P1ETD1_9RHOB|nr:AMP-binding protein [Shimia marina]CUH53698.1 putative sulfoacetate--CoA ligase [Shimia marina]SFD70697.1 crotonobetaine/carnitine-CoA ligase [Shimia marina]